MIKKTRKPRTASKLKRPYKSPDGHTIMMTDQQYNFAHSALNIKDSNVLINRVMELYECKRSVARVIARQNFQKPNIVAYMGDRGYKALDTIYEVMTDEKASHGDKLNAAKDLADRTFGKAVQHSTSVGVQFTQQVSGEQYQV